MLDKRVYEIHIYDEFMIMQKRRKKLITIGFESKKKWNKTKKTNFYDAET
jgi:hypothetical protein